MDISEILTYPKDLNIDRYYRFGDLMKSEEEIKEQLDTLRKIYKETKYENIKKEMKYKIDVLMWILYDYPMFV